MYYTESQISDLLHCPSCNKPHSLESRIVECGETVCFQCLSSDHGFMCKACDGVHSAISSDDYERLTANQLLNRLLVEKPVQVYRGEIYKKVEANLKMLDEAFGEYEKRVKKLESYKSKYEVKLTEFLEDHLKLSEYVHRARDYEKLLDDLETELLSGLLDSKKSYSQSIEKLAETKELIDQNLASPLNEFLTYNLNKNPEEFVYQDVVSLQSIADQPAETTSRADSHLDKFSILHLVNENFVIGHRDDGFFLIDIKSDKITNQVHFENLRVNSIISNDHSVYVTTNTNQLTKSYDLLVLKLPSLQLRMKSKFILDVKMACDTQYLAVLAIHAPYIHVYDANTIQPINSFGSYGMSNGKINTLEHILIRDGLLYQLETALKRLQVFDLVRGKHLRTINFIKSSSELKSCSKFYVDSLDRIIVLDSKSKTLRFFDEDGVFLASIQLDGCQNPTDFCMTKRSKIAVLCDSTKSVSIH